jgi:putative phosphoribosyl transferase
MNAERLFRDRTDAGIRLAQHLEEFRDTDAVVLGIPRGGVPVAFEVASRLGLDLNIVLVRKLGLPEEPEVAMGAIGEDGERVFDESFLSRGWVTRESAGGVEDRERAELADRVGRFRGGATGARLDERTAIVVDDGVATGATIRVACRVARARGAVCVIAAVPVRPAAFTARDAEADAIVSVLSPSDLWAVGAYYRDFSQTTDDEVARLLDASRS